MPSYALIFMIMMMASVGLPGTSGFVGEFLVLVGAFKYSPWLAAFASTGVILGACYMLYLYRRVILGKLTKDSLKKILDLSPREMVVFAPLIILVLWMGVYPTSFLDVMHVSVDHLISQLEKGLAVAQMGPVLSGQ
jgi:NADH-quinone oxidoreductase subunit M